MGTWVGVNWLKEWAWTLDGPDQNLRLPSERGSPADKKALDVISSANERIGTAGINNS